jgi:glycosyltransferase involved in cell wall biosynthesis
MAFGLPVVAFDLRETRVSAGDAAVYVQPNDERQYAEAIVALLDDEPRRALMGKLAAERVEQELAWSHSESAYLGVYKRVLGEGKPRKPRKLGKPGKPGRARRARRARQRAGA